MRRSPWEHGWVARVPPPWAAVLALCGQAWRRTPCRLWTRRRQHCGRRGVCPLRRHPCCRRRPCPCPLPQHPTQRQHLRARATPACTSSLGASARSPASGGRRRRLWPRWPPTTLQPTPRPWLRLTPSCGSAPWTRRLPRFMPTARGSWSGYPTAPRLCPSSGCTRSSGTPRETSSATRPVSWSRASCKRRASTSPRSTRP